VAVQRSFVSLESEILPFFVERIRDHILAWIRRYPEKAQTIEEIRLRKGLPLCLVLHESDVLLSQKRGEENRQPYLIPSGQDVEKTLALICDCSYYALEEQLASGYITIPGGHRVGLSGQVASWGNGHTRLTEIGGLSFRIAREIKGLAEPLLRRLVTREGRMPSTLVISPPGCGKTTLIRDMARILGEGLPSLGLRPSQVGIVDERSEIASCFQGVPQLDVGPRADVLDRCLKAKGMMTLLRAARPDVLVTDELGGEEDAKAVAQTICAGVSVIATCHGNDVEDVRRRPYSSWLVNAGYFEMAVVLSRRKGPGTLEYVGEVR